MRTFIELTPYHGIHNFTYYVAMDAITSMIDLSDGGSHIYTDATDYVCLESVEYIFDKMKEAEEVING